MFSFSLTKYLYNSLVPFHHLRKACFYWLGKHYIGVQPQYLQGLPIVEDDSFLLPDASAYDRSLEREP